MNKITVSISILLLVLTTAFTAFAQDDETREGTGLPTLIGENAERGNRMNISGRVTLQGTDQPKRRPLIAVSVLLSGAVLERATTNDKGFFNIRNVPRETLTVIVEVDGNEAARQVVAPSPMGNASLQISIPWPSLAAPAKPGVISVDQLYERTSNNQTLFNKALEAAKGSERLQAVTLFNELLTADPKDYLAWTELGSVYFKHDELDNAEACYFKAIELKRDYFIALLNLGKLYFGRKQYDDSVLVLTNAVKARPDSADAHILLAEAYLQTKKGNSAVYHYNEALKLAPIEKAEVHLRLASLYDAAGLKTKASAEYKLFLQKQPDYVEKNRLETYIKENPPK
ncbi:MAG TPA: tetratricopeptide repeat protein [Pyrinomonadaceae bacterium]|nr:tetratricopeptide repeat protein [Chloracidobacterium sp.]HQX54926.1 tetratricopeptide repeat protein [Pyrinomonadaceae bacterium]MBK7803368.1 tetratricopeptide repeat protein [Chloracidobacterium sp.]MBL0241142.1 tetratricopeptide repeat protein [Chloracidobacterium sp.]HQY66792.1 tetratricopeptide repeat protein [Pyrinomonadaceae bacterium]